MILVCHPDMQVSESIRKQGYSISTPCGGRGNCGKCKVRVVEGELLINTMDRIQLSEEELKRRFAAIRRHRPARRWSIPADRGGHLPSGQRAPSILWDLHAGALPRRREGKALFDLLSDR